MPPKRFLVHLAQSIDKAKIRKMCELMELSNEETTIVLSRYCDGLNIDQIASNPFNISPDRQRRLLPIIESKIMSWIMDNFEFFNDRQVNLLHRWISPE